MDAGRSVLKTRLRGPRLHSPPEGKGAHGGDYGLHGFEDFPRRCAFAEGDAHVGLDLFLVGAQGNLHDDLQQFLGLAVQEALAGVGGLDELAVLLRPFGVGQGR